jgi:superfamily II DNA helicase RecQ
VLVVQPEQLQSFGGHLPRFAQVLRNPQFSKLVKRVHVDEAHTIYTAGTSLYGQPPFRSAWGKLGELRLVLPKGTPVQALSGTFPPHIVNCIKEQLLFQSDNDVMINLTSNRPNITYAVHPIVGSLSNFQNLQFLIPEHGGHPFDLKRIPKTVVFHDNLQEAANAAKCLNNLFPGAMQNRQIAKHYHSVMSSAYLEQTFQDFASADGTTRILHATSGASTVWLILLLTLTSSLFFNYQGLDVPDIQCVVQFGMCRDVPNTVQRCGRGGRAPSTSAVFLILYKPWAMATDISSVAEDLDDPDRPLQAITKTSKKPERTGVAMYRLIQTSSCMRKFFANYLADETPNGVS